MEKSFLILSLLMLTLINFLHVPLGAQADINIACGATDPFTDPNGNYWVGDDQFIQSGSTATVPSTSPEAPFLKTVRYFRDGGTNCYTIPGVTQGVTIQVIAIFQYGNYDNLALPPSFGLQFDGSKWAEVETSMDVNLVVYGMTYWAVADTVSVCLAPDATARVPFISAIQIREAPPSPSTEPPPSNPGAEAPSPNPSITIPTEVPSPFFTAAKAAAKRTFRGFIYLVTILPAGTFITLVVSVIACIQTRKKNNRAHNPGDAADKSKDEVQGTDN